MKLVLLYNIVKIFDKYISSAFIAYKKRARFFTSLKEDDLLPVSSEFASGLNKTKDLISF